MVAAQTKQELVRSHAKDLRKRSGALVGDLGTITAEVSNTVKSYLKRSLTSSNGVVEPSSGSALAMRDLDRQYVTALRAVGYHEATGAFVGNFSDQIDNFRDMYATMGSAVNLPTSVPLDAKDGEVLATRAALSLAALESSTIEIVASLRQASALILGQAPMDQVIEHVSSIVDRTAGVERLARDLEMTFFRTVSGLVYRNLESSGLSPLYSYAGLESPSNRPFCKSMLSSEPITRSAIDSLNNGKIPGVFDNAGGPGCSHFWWIEGLHEQAS